MSKKRLALPHKYDLTQYPITFHTVTDDGKVTEKPYLTREHIASIKYLGLKAGAREWRFDYTDEGSKINRRIMKKNVGKEVAVLWNGNILITYVIHEFLANIPEKMILGIDDSRWRFQTKPSKRNLHRDIEDDFFGLLKYDWQLNWYEAAIKFNGRAVKIYFPLDECEDNGKLISEARETLSDIKTLDVQGRRYAADKLLTIKNEYWSDEDRPQVSYEEFIAKLKLGSICIGCDGDYDLGYEDGDLFGGHEISVQGNRTSGFTEADI